MKPPYEYRAHLVRVIDGDTIDVIIDLGFGVMFGNERDPRRLRLADVDTPELRSRDAAEREQAQEAKQLVERLLGGLEAPLMIQTIKTRAGKERQTFGRYVAKVWFEMSGVWSCLNDRLIEEGYGSKG